MNACWSGCRAYTYICHYVKLCKHERDDRNKTLTTRIISIRNIPYFISNTINTFWCRSQTAPKFTHPVARYIPVLAASETFTLEHATSGPPPPPVLIAAGMGFTTGRASIPGKRTTPGTPSLRLLRSPTVHMPISCFAC